MSIPNVIFGSYGDEKEISSGKILPLGTPMVVPDGRLYRYAKAGAAALVAGNLVAQPAIVASHTLDLVVQAAVAVGAKTVPLTLAGTVTTANQYAGGFLYSNDQDGEGMVYKIKSNDAAASVSTCTFTLEPDDTIKVALKATTSECGVRKSSYDSVTIKTAATAIGAIAGVAPVAVTATYYFWVQRSGPAACLAAGTLVAGDFVAAASSVDGALGPHVIAATAGTGLWAAIPLGQCIAAAASTDFGLFDLTIE